MAVSQFIFGLANTLTVMLISRFIFGVFFSGIAVNFMAYFNDNYEGSLKSKMISYNLAIIALGLALGSLIGGYLGDYMHLSNIYFLQSVLFIIVSCIFFISKRVYKYRY